MSSVIAPRSYIMKVKLPAEAEDWMKRPAYITKNDDGVAICDNRQVATVLTGFFYVLTLSATRLQYLVQKGAILRKGCVDAYSPYSMCFVRD